ncbi:MAG: glycine zipper 2TM domain-containing protein [Phenylobacterium sp.]|nr:MAG: glycine zipper 2TM domain-containing protein [Phenylobacterium sp.]
MRKHLLVVGIAAAALIPSFAMAQQQTCEQQHQNRVAGTVVGAGLGALLGGAIAGSHDRTAGVVVGGVGGAIAGNQLSKSNADCAHAYGYYDHDGAWHATTVEHGMAAGYYNRDGGWVQGSPNGYYDANGHWMTANTAASASNGYYDNDHRWVPFAAAGYYDSQGHWYETAAAADRYRTNTAFVARNEPVYVEPAHDVRAREDRIGQRIQAGVDNGSLSRRDARRARDTLQEIRQQESRMQRYQGELSQGDNARIQGRLDNLSHSLRFDS